MITPLKRLAAVAFASLLSGAAFADPGTDLPDENDVAPAPAASAGSNPYNQGTTADGRTIVAPGTYGPFQGPTCVAGGDCTAATNNSLEDVGALQRKEAAGGPSEGTRSVMKSEDGMLANGTYSKMERDNPDNPGQALITLPDGSVFISDYKRGVDTIPKKPEELAADTSQSSWVRGRAQAIVDAQASKDAEKKGFGIASTGDKGTKSAATPPPTEAGAEDEGGGQTTGQQDTAGGQDGPTDLGGMGNMIADNFGSGGGPGSSDVGGDTGSGSGSGSSRGGGSSTLGTKANAATRQMMDQLNNSDLSYTHNQDFANSTIMNQLRKDASIVPSKASGADTDPQADSAGTNFFRGK